MTNCFGPLIIDKKFAADAFMIARYLINNGCTIKIAKVALQTSTNPDNVNVYR